MTITARIVDVEEGTLATRLRLPTVRVLQQGATAGRFCIRGSVRNTYNYSNLAHGGGGKATLSLVGHIKFFASQSSFELWHN